MTGDEAETRGLETRTRVQEEWGENERSWLEWLFDRLLDPTVGGLGGKARILELGGGNGALWARNMERVPQGWRVALSDVSTAMVKPARKVAGGNGHIDRLLANAEAIPTRGEQWDAVVASGVFDYLEPAARQVAFAETRRVLRDDGQLLAATGARGHLRELEQLVRPFVAQADYGGDPDTFGVENGAEQLEPWFLQVRLFLFEDTLVFRSPGPLLAYLLSEESIRRQLSGERREELEKHVRDKLAAHGEIRATIRKGLFVAR